MFKMRGLPCGSRFMGANWLMALNAATLLFTGKNGFLNRYNSPSGLRFTSQVMLFGISSSRLMGTIA